MNAFNVFRRNLTVYRKGLGYFDDNGLYTQALESTFTIKASVQPLTGKALEALPEGLRSTDVYTLYTDATLNVASQDDEQKADEVEIGGTRYEVQRQQAWDNGVVNHNAYIVQRVSL